MRVCVFLLASVVFLGSGVSALLSRSGQARRRASLYGGGALKLLDPVHATDALLSVQHHVPHWAELAAQGIAAAQDAAASSSGAGGVDGTVLVCPQFGEPGWGPLCGLQNPLRPLFQGFDAYQSFIQNTIVSLHDVYRDKLGIRDSFGVSIVSFTILVRLLILPLTFQQLGTSSKSLALAPKIAEIKAKFDDDKDMQNLMIGRLYQQTETNPLAGCLPALIQIPVFLGLYRSFLNLASTNQMAEPFLWLPNLQGPVFGERSTDWILKWTEGVPTLGWRDTALYATIPLLLYLAQAVSLNLLSPPSDDPAIKKTQAILKYLPLLLAYFSLSVPAGLGVYWITNNVLSTVSTVSIKEYYKRTSKEIDFDVEAIAGQGNPYYMPTWGYTSREQAVEEATLNLQPDFKPKIPRDFV